MTTIRQYRTDDHAALLDIWRRSVEATHHFLTMGEIAGLHPLVSELLASGGLEPWVLADTADAPIGWLRMDGAKIEVLFLDPDRRRQGRGRRLKSTRDFPVGAAREIGQLRPPHPRLSPMRMLQSLS